jgi:hypothetical protein
VDHSRLQAGHSPAGRPRADRNHREVNLADRNHREVNLADRNHREVNQADRGHREVNQADRSHREVSPADRSHREENLADRNRRRPGARSLRADSRHPAHEPSRGYLRSSLLRDCQGNG